MNRLTVWGFFYGDKTEMKIENDIYLTRDLPEAAALYSLRQKLLRLEKEAEHFIFVFQDKEFCQKLANAFLNRELTVDAKTYAESLRTLKDKIFQQKEKNSR